MIKRLQELRPEEANVGLRVSSFLFTFSDLVIAPLFVPLANYSGFGGERVLPGIQRIYDDASTIIQPLCRQRDLSIANFKKVTPIVVMVHSSAAYTGYAPQDREIIAFLDHELAFWREQVRLLTIDKNTPITQFTVHTTSVAAECFALLQTLALEDD